MTREYIKFLKLKKQWVLMLVQLHIQIASCGLKQNTK